MKRYDFAPGVVPRDARALFDSHLPYFDPELFAQFKDFYNDYALELPASSDSLLADYPNVDARMMTRTLDRSALILRSSNDDYDERRYKLFKRDYFQGKITEFTITESRFVVDDRDFNPEANYSMLYLAKNKDGVGVLEVGGTRTHPSVWIYDGNEYLLEPIPNPNTL